MCYDSDFILKEWRFFDDVVSFCEHFFITLFAKQFSYLLHYLVDEDRTIQPPHTKEEIKDGQWLGVTVKSQGGTGGKVCIFLVVVIFYVN